MKQINQIKTDTLKSDKSSLSDLIVVQTVMGKLLLISSSVDAIALCGSCLNLDEADKSDQDRYSEI
jgi:hypothetical protein